MQRATGSEKVPKVSRKGANGSPKGATWRPKGAKSEPTGDQNASKNRSSEKVDLRIENKLPRVEFLGAILEPFS